MIAAVARSQPNSGTAAESLQASIDHLPADVVDIILGYLDDADFWRTRKSHRVFRLNHPAAVFKRRAIYWWLRTSPEEALTRHRGDIFVALCERKRVPRTFNPWLIVMRSGSIALFDTVRTVIPFPTDWSKCHTASAIERGHIALVAHAHASYPDLPAGNDFIHAVSHGRVAVASALSRLGKLDAQYCAEYAAHYGNADYVRALFDEHGPTLAMDRVIRAAALFYAHTKVFDAFAMFADEPATWVLALLTSAACNNDRSARWIIDTTQQPHDVLRRALRVALAHDSWAVVRCLADACPDLQSRLDPRSKRCQFGCALLCPTSDRIPPNYVPPCSIASGLQSSQPQSFFSRSWPTAGAQKS